MRLGRALVLPVTLAVGMAGGMVAGIVAQGQPLDDVPDQAPSATTPPPVNPIVPATLLAWTPGGLPAGFAGRVSKLRGVDHTVAVESGIAWLSRSYSSTGAVVDRPPPGLAIPLEVAAATPARYGPFLAPGDRMVLPALAKGEAVLGASSAALRHLGVGAVLRFGALSLRVAGILPDAEIGAHELFVSRATARRLGVTVDRYLLIDPAAGVARERLAAGIRRALPPGALVQIRGPGETPYFRQGDAVLPQVKIKQVFGEFAAKPVGGFLEIDPAWVAAHIVTATVPILGSVRCNRALLPQLRGALSEIRSEGLSSLLDPGDFAGCYSARFLNRIPNSTISHHSWGMAVDLNARANPFGRTPHQDPRVVAAFERWGFTWGGQWLLPDGMHFEFLRFPSSG